MKQMGAWSCKSMRRIASIASAAPSRHLRTLPVYASSLLCASILTNLYSFPLRSSYVEYVWICMNMSSCTWNILDLLETWSAGIHQLDGTWGRRWPSIPCHVRPVRPVRPLRPVSLLEIPGDLCFPWSDSEEGIFLICISELLGLWNALEALNLLDILV